MGHLAWHQNHHLENLAIWRLSPFQQLFNPVNPGSDTSFLPA
jgi:hypothetical protein